MTNLSRRMRAACLGALFLVAAGASGDAYARCKNDGFDLNPCTHGFTGGPDKVDLGRSKHGYGGGWGAGRGYDDNRFDSDPFDRKPRDADKEDDYSFRSGSIGDSLRDVRSRNADTMTFSNGARYRRSGDGWVDSLGTKRNPPGDRKCERSWLGGQRCD
ncbi:MAG: hypothetical protein RIM80_01280 [Alphaproteobacteria bacterium]